MTAWTDFNDAEAQQSGFDLIPRGTVVPVRMTLKPGGYDDPSQGWGGGYATESFETGSIYLAAEFVVTSGEYAKRKTLAVRSLQTHLPARLLDDLALVDAAPNAIGIRDVARAAADEVEGISVAFLVCGSAPTAQSLRAASNAFPPGVALVAIVCDPDAVPGLRRVAGLSVLTIGYLDDLRVALQRTAAVA